MSTLTGMDDNDEYVYVEWEDPTTTNSSSASPLDLLMRHSSPFAAHGGESGAVVSSTASSTLTERTTSPSLLLRPRSNPRTRTPMRYTAVMGGVETSFLTSRSNESKVRHYVTLKEKIDERNGSQWIKVESRRKLKERKSNTPHTLSRI